MKDCSSGKSYRCRRCGEICTDEFCSYTCYRQYGEFHKPQEPSPKKPIDKDFIQDMVGTDTATDIEPSPKVDGEKDLDRHYMITESRIRAIISKQEREAVVEEIRRTLAPEIQYSPDPQKSILYVTVLEEVLDKIAKGE